MRRSPTSCRFSTSAAARRARPAPRFLRHAACGAARGAMGRAARRGPASPRAHRRGRGRAPRARTGAGPRPRRRGPGHRTAPRGAANCCTSTARAASGWAACARCACRAAIAPRASRGGWPRRRWRSRDAAGKSDDALPTSPRRRPWRRCSRARSTRPKRAAWAARSTPRRGCSTSGGGWRSKARRRCCWKALPKRTVPWRRTFPCTRFPRPTSSICRRC